MEKVDSTRDEKGITYEDSQKSLQSPSRITQGPAEGA
ncbi:hypothetical protein QG37_01802 [Candidozyma auris]|nr:hypothetical protein QG37_01802 [[Candida] auris]